MTANNHERLPDPVQPSLPAPASLPAPPFGGPRRAHSPRPPETATRSSWVLRPFSPGCPAEVISPATGTSTAAMPLAAPAPVESGIGRGVDEAGTRRSSPTRDQLVGTTEEPLATTEFGGDTLTGEAQSGVEDAPPPPRNVSARAWDTWDASPDAGGSCETPEGTAWEGVTETLTGQTAATVPDEPSVQMSESDSDSWTTSAYAADEVREERVEVVVAIALERVAQRLRGGELAIATASMPATDEAALAVALAALLQGAGR